ncbi:MAG: sigma-70 family RNA polymerase sigma factor [Planctomycetales bacterium]|nr:sigma-70 family RNA polymerase sigma factor [Planctomycetales bacterium]
MSNSNSADQLLVDRIGLGDDSAWEDLIARYEGRLLAFVESRLRNRSSSEDIVQETFVGFLNSLPNYDRKRPLESYLFSICAYKLTDFLRREGRRPAISLTQSSGEDSSSPWQIVSAHARGASSIARSGERKQLEENAIVDALRSQIEKWQEKGDWVKLMCVELLFVVGASNKQVAEQLNITEQQVANFKFDFLARTKALVGRQNLDEEVFPELSAE